MSDLKEKIKLAYKKLKSAVYYDKNQLILRNKIVDYEKKLDFSNEKIDKKLEKIIEVLKSDKEEIWTSYIKKNLDKIDTHYFPKKIKNKNKSEDIIINKYSQDIVLTEVQKFIDINVESQILGILWVMTVGEVLDEEIYENSYGNRLKKTIDIKNKKDIIEEDKSPRLFSPYFLQYEKWRNNALEVAENILKNNQDAIILTLDFQRFYYNIDLLEKDKDDYYNLYTTKNGKDTSVRRLNEFVFEVISKYSENNRKSYKFLPINFYPSNIISNYYLKEFDNKLIERWNPSYYGRYVDDIIIVDKVEKNSQLYLKMKKNQLDKACIINYFLCGCNGNKNDECCKKSAKEFDSSLLKFDEKEKYYYVNENIIENRRRQLRIQDQKVNIFYFNELGSNALLDKFKKELRKNTSEFRYLPEDDATLVNNDYSEIYDLKNNDSINKLNSIEDIQINKYSLSKYLGKLTRIDLLIDDTNNNKFYADILKIFDNKNIVLNYMTWEKVLQIFLTNKKFEIAKKYILSIVQIISEIKYTNENQDNRTLRKTLMLYLYRSMSR